ncbi:FecR family protein [Sphingomonas montanisoli]|uniref:FecR family protein n=1 Tax=Sphingomonas montanisoli TaxID=2606412 RepID=UPI001FE43E5B|nr:FecR family protein [Sphingomonas montanisoli]
MNSRSIVALVALAIAAQPGLAAEIGRVKRSTGIATIERGKAKVPTAPGTQLQTGDVLVTGKDGQIALTFIDDTRFAVGPNSRVALSQFAYDRTRQTGSFLTDVNRGSVAVVSGQIAKSGRDAMKVRTPTALLGVRGTRFIVEAGK